MAAACNHPGGLLLKSRLTFATTRLLPRRKVVIKTPVAELHTRKKGSLADKFENLAHLLVDAMPGKIAKATLSQCAITSGIATDKAIRLRGEGLYPDAAAELCSLLNINRSQLPPTLELQPGEEIPRELLKIIETTPNAQGEFEPVPTRQFHHPDFGPLQSAPNQADLPDGYVRLSDDAGNIFIFPTADLITVENDGNPS